jgi:hypothetical protein
MIKLVNPQSIQYLYLDYYFIVKILIYINKLSQIGKLK